MWIWTCVLLALACGATVVSAQPLGTLRGRVYDALGAPLPAASVTVLALATGIHTATAADAEGRYQLAALPPGTYRVTVAAAGFRTAAIDRLQVEVGRTLVQDVRLPLGDRSETVVVRAQSPLVDRSSAVVGHIVTSRTIEQVPLNGRHFIDLALLVPGAVSPSQTGFSSRPIRGVGALAFNTSGSREEAVAFVVNGVTSNNLTFGSLIFEPPLLSIEEVKIDNSTFGAQHGHVSGAVVNVATRSGTDTLRGELFAFFRHDALDARNFFELTGSEPAPFQSQQFGAALGGPIRRGQTFFYATYDGLRQRQGLTLNSIVPSDAERAAVTDPVALQLLTLVPRANVIDDVARTRFVGPAPAIADRDRWSVDVRHAAGSHDTLHVYYGAQRTRSIEPAAQGNNIPGFGSVQRPRASLLTVAATHIFGTALINEARFGRSDLIGGTYSSRPLSPADFGVRSGVTREIGLPQMMVAGAMSFGTGTLPQGRFDTSYVVTDTLTHARGRHTLAFGGEYRHFINENFAEGVGVFNFPTMAAFLNGMANAFSITLDERRSIVDQRALGLFAQERMTVGDRLTLELGARWEWFVTPSEREDRFVVFDASSASLLRVGTDIPRIYRQNMNLEPRLGLAWDLSGDGSVVVRAAYAHAADQPGTTAVRDTAGNPPYGVPLAANGTIPLSDAIDRARPAGLAPATIDPEFRNARAQTWNANVQRQFSGSMAATVGYLGARGRNLRISRNLNQPINGVRPFPALSPSSPILPGATLGTITQVESTGFSNYHGVWVGLTRRLAGGLQFDASYTWSRSMDTNSLNSSGFAVQDSDDIAGQYGPSDFDARHRFVLSATYVAPSGGHLLVRGWRLGAVVQSQSGNPVNIVTTNSTLTGVPGTVRPDVTGPIRIIGSVNQWFDPSVFAAVDRFGTLARNAVPGPAFHNTDVSIARSVPTPGPVTMRLRADVFNLFNHANLGPPGNVVGSPSFGVISRTRLPTGEAGSSRQLQLAATLTF